MRNFCCLLLLSFAFTFNCLHGQEAKLEAYVFETNNRGYLNLVKIEIEDETGAFSTKAFSDKEGFFSVNLPVGKTYKITATKDVFEEKVVELSTVGKKDGEKVYAKVEMQRLPGYLFDVTMAEKFVDGMEQVDAIDDALIEIFNNTTNKEELTLKSHPSHTFNYTFEQGNHYTVMIRKEGFFTKRMEAFVNVDGCIMCFDGIDEIQPGQPGISDNLTAGHQMGTLVANVELERIRVGEPIKVDNIYYDLGKSEIRTDAAKQLDGVIHLMKNNPALFLELGSHTDSRGNDEFNQKLSFERANAAVEYIITMGDIPRNRIKAVGYGEAKLVNDCKNGVKCSDRKHQQNRRTEIKIIGVADYDPYADKTLAEIIRQDKMAELLAEVQDQEILEIKEGEELPEEIRAQIEKSNAPDGQETAVASSQPMIKTEPEIKSTKTPVKKKELQTTSAPSQADKIAESAPSSPVVPTKQNVDTNMNGRSRGGDSYNSKELEVNKTPFYVKVLQVKSDFSGFLVEIKRSRAELPLTDEIFRKHGNIKKDVLGDGSVSYMLGNFKSKADASKFLKTIILPQYGKAKVIKYSNGARS